MLLRNLDMGSKPDMLVNGSRGVVAGFRKKQVSFRNGCAEHLTLTQCHCAITCAAFCPGEPLTQRHVANHFYASLCAK